MHGVTNKGYLYEINNLRAYNRDNFLSEFNEKVDKAIVTPGDHRYKVIDNKRTNCPYLIYFADSFLNRYKIDEDRGSFIQNARYFLQPAGSTLLPHCDIRIKCAANFLLYDDNDPVQFYDDEGKNPINIYYKSSIINILKPHGLKVTKDRLMVKLVFKNNYFGDLVERIQSV